MRNSVAALALIALGLVACHSIGQFLGELLTVRPPAPLESAEVTSDARLDSAGRILGSFVGEGTSRQVHLLSSDTGFIATLARRYRPERARRGDIWPWLARQRVFEINLKDPQAAELLDGRMLAGSPLGHTSVRLRDLYLRGGNCGGRGAQAELVVDDAGGGTLLQGPVVGSLRGLEASGETHRATRWPVDPPSDAFTRRLLVRTEAAMDSEFTIPLEPRDSTTPLFVNTLADVDAADVLPFRIDGSTVRYAVSLRERRLTGNGEEVLASTVMVWDSAGSWKQFVFLPHLLDLWFGRPAPRAPGPAVFWRRLQAISGFAFGREYLWLEQVNVEDGTILWTILEPRENMVVAAAEVAGPCR